MLPWYVSSDLRHQPPLPLVERVLLVAAVQLLNGGKELVRRHSSHHRGNPVDDGQAMLCPAIEPL